MLLLKGIKMNWTNPLFLLSIITGPVFITTGYVILKFPPKKNSFYGYRTANSMKSQERWGFAQKYSAKEFIKYGVLFTLFAIPGLFSAFNELVSLVIGIGATLYNYCHSNN